ncbi:hypothetical protein EHP00_657 [Ecytonucleospora hepatopenaei]|uniref:DUF5097 domain-containing protein n=1 Tax=Ecytonucleospora hepatopenaei TaxID=646526 RepID=A0A1W0E872_9MICR|nr:hypothetical protein EHP00_2547 [Ecytonucleospora hepatopenaei]OQS55604.1 hypothetical protein EHP00_657 [Ecytonucleospora hepatopenaei]
MFFESIEMRKFICTYFIKNSQKQMDQIARELVNELETKCFVDDIVFWKEKGKEKTFKVVKINKETKKVLIKNDSLEVEVEASKLERSVKITLPDINLFLSYIIKPGPIPNLLIDNVIKKIKEKEFFEKNKPLGMAAWADPSKGFYERNTIKQNRQATPIQNKSNINDFIKPIGQKPSSPPVSKKLKVITKEEPFEIEKHLSKFDITLNSKFKDSLLETMCIFNFFKTHEKLLNLENLTFETFVDDLIDIGKDKVFYSFFRNVLNFCEDELLDQESRVMDPLRLYAEMRLKECDLTVVNKKFTEMSEGNYKIDYKHFVSEMCVESGESKFMVLSTFFNVGKSVANRLEILSIWMDIILMTEKFNIYVTTLTGIKRTPSSRKNVTKKKRFDDTKKELFVSKLTALISNDQVKQELVYKGTEYTVFLWNNKHLLVYKNTDRKLLYEINSRKQAEMFCSTLGKTKHGTSTALYIKGKFS